MELEKYKKYLWLISKDLGEIKWLAVEEEIGPLHLLLYHRHGDEKWSFSKCISIDNPDPINQRLQMTETCILSYLT